MEPLLMQALFLQHTVQLQALARNHEINRIDDLRVERVDIVNLRYTEKSDQREFSALITASARDYYLDDRNQEFLRGDSESGAVPGVLDLPALGGALAASGDRTGGRNQICSRMRISSRR
ncbi:MAG: hypothetical protein M0C28_32885 [Candidatus Moduliflexus flocculans]|nr:hypothetical protein [Candidatus Moduliflexus flocculans]